MYDFEIHYYSKPFSLAWAFFAVLLFSLNGWSCHIWCAILINDIMDPHMPGLSTRKSLLCDLFYVTRHQVYWGLTHNMVYFWYSKLISHTQTHIHTQRHTVQSGVSTLRHPYKYIFTPPVTCSQQLSLLNWINN